MTEGTLRTSYLHLILLTLPFIPFRNFFFFHLLLFSPPSWDSFSLSWRLHLLFSFRFCISDVHGDPPRYWKTTSTKLCHCKTTQILLLLWKPHNSNYLSYRVTDQFWIETSILRPELRVETSIWHTGDVQWIEKKRNKRFSPYYYHGWLTLKTVLFTQLFTFIIITKIIIVYYSCVWNKGQESTQTSTSLRTIIPLLFRIPTLSLSSSIPFLRSTPIVVVSRRFSLTEYVVVRLVCLT